MKNKIFYYRHSNNEIYELKFNNVLIDMNGRINNINIGKFYVEYVSAEVAGLGTLTFTLNGFLNKLCVSNIYDTIEKAIRGRNNNTLSVQDRKNGLVPEDLFKVNYGFPWDCSKFNLKFNIPNHIYKVNTGFYNQNVEYRTWIWDGTDALETKSVSIFDPFDFNNYNGELIYDLINEECLYDEDIIGYATREECVNSHTIKIHRF